MIHFQEDLYFTCSRNLVVFVVIYGFVTCFVDTLFVYLAVTGVMHEADDTYSIQST